MLKLTTGRPKKQADIQDKTPPPPRNIHIKYECIKTTPMACQKLQYIWSASIYTCIVYHQVYVIYIYIQFVLYIFDLYCIINKYQINNIKCTMQNGKFYN